jgi:hypothetical protein
MSDPGTSDGYERCGADKKHKAGPCKLPAGHGTDHVGTGRCRRHGGNTPTHQKHAERIEAERAVARFGLAEDGTPAPKILLREISRSSAMTQFLAAQVADLTADELVWGTTKRKTRLTGDGEEVTEVEQEARPNIWLVLLERERKTLRELIETAHRCNIEERLTQQAEQHGSVLVQFIRAVFGDPEMCTRPEQFAAMATVVPRHLRAIGGES